MDGLLLDLDRSTGAASGPAGRGLGPVGLPRVLVRKAGGPRLPRNDRSRRGIWHGDLREDAVNAWQPVLGLVCRCDETPRGSAAEAGPGSASPGQGRRRQAMVGVARPWSVSPGQGRRRQAMVGVARPWSVSPGQGRRRQASIGATRPWGSPSQQPPRLPSGQPRRLPVPPRPGSSGCPRSNKRSRDLPAGPLPSYAGARAKAGAQRASEAPVERFLGLLHLPHLRLPPGRARPAQLAAPRLCPLAPGWRTPGRRGSGFSAVLYFGMSTTCRSSCGKGMPMPASSRASLERRVSCSRTSQYLWGSAQQRTSKSTELPPSSIR